MSPGLNGSPRDYTPRSLPPAPSHSMHPAEPALGPYLRAIRAHKPLMVLTTLAFVAAALAWLAFARTPTYEATANLLVTPLPQDDQTFRGLQLLRDSGDPTRTVQTAASLVTAPEAARRTATQLGNGWTTQRVFDSV